MKEAAVLDTVRRRHGSGVPPTSLLAALSPGTPVSVSSVSLLSKLYEVKPLKSPLSASDCLREGEEQVPSPQATSSISRKWTLRFSGSKRERTVVEGDPPASRPLILPTLKAKGS